MGGEGDSKGGFSWLTFFVTALTSSVLSFFVSCYSSELAFERQEKAQIDKANLFADEQEKIFQEEIRRRWEDYRRDSVTLEAAWPESLRSAAGLRSARGFGATAAAIVADSARINTYFREKIIDGRTNILRSEEDRRSEIQRMRKTGIIH